MSRMLLLGASLVALVVAIVLGNALLYGLSALLLASLLYLQFGRGVTVATRKSSHADAPLRPASDLADLGILEIRPKEKVTAVRGSGNGILEQEPVLIEKLKQSSGDRSAVAKGETQDDLFELGDGLVSAPRPVQKKSDRSPGGDDARGQAGTASGDGSPAGLRPVSRFPVSFAGESIDRSAIVPLLESAVASMNAWTVTVIARIAESSRYRIAGLVSRDTSARAGGQFTADAPYISQRRPKDEVVHLSADSLDHSHTRYYDGSVRISHLAVLPIAASTGDYLLIADFQDPAADVELVDPLMIGYAAALRALLSSSTILSNAALAKTSIVVSRALVRAREENSPLAMALVCMKGGERFLDSERDVVLQAERELESILVSLTPGGKIEKLADLTFGVFLTEEVNKVEEWALSLQDAVEERSTAPEVTSAIVGSVMIGVAMLTERHTSADELREDALAALEESFQSGACTILE